MPHFEPHGLAWDADLGASSAELIRPEVGAAGFADCLIAHGNHAAGYEVTFTFDRKAAAGRYVEQLE